MNPLKNKHWVGIHRVPDGEEDRSKTRKGLYWRKQENEAKHGMRLRVWWATYSD